MLDGTPARDIQSRVARWSWPHPIVEVVDRLGIVSWPKAPGNTQELAHEGPAAHVLRFGNDQTEFGRESLKMTLV
jgi:hypothetical protein